MSPFYVADLHIHTCLSPCAELEMLPELIVQRAQELKLQIIAITDHNSAENVASVINAAQGSGIVVLPGMEVQSREEVHLLSLFDALEQITEWQAFVYEHLPPLKNDERRFGEQLLLDEKGRPDGYLDRLLIASTDLSVEAITQAVLSRGGLCIPAHVDRPANSIIANLGFIPPDLDVSGVEISANTGPVEARQRFPQLQQYGLVASGDAHRLKEMMRRTTLKMSSVSVSELAFALSGDGDRGVWVDGIHCSRAV